jgi:hypothetical protein
MESLDPRAFAISRRAARQRAGGGQAGRPALLPLPPRAPHPPTLRPRPPRPRSVPIGPITREEHHAARSARQRGPSPPPAVPGRAAAEGLLPDGGGPASVVVRPPHPEGHTPQSLLSLALGAADPGSPPCRAPSPTPPPPPPPASHDPASLAHHFALSSIDDHLPPLPRHAAFGAPWPVGGAARQQQQQQQQHPAYLEAISHATTMLETMEEEGHYANPPSSPQAASLTSRGGAAGQGGAGQAGAPGVGASDSPSAWFVADDADARVRWAWRLGWAVWFGMAPRRRGEGGQARASGRRQGQGRWPRVAGPGSVGTAVQRACLPWQPPCPLLLLPGMKGGCPLVATHVMLVAGRSSTVTSNRLRHPPWPPATLLPPLALGLIFFGEAALLAALAGARFHPRARPVPAVAALLLVTFVTFAALGRVCEVAGSQVRPASLPFKPPFKGAETKIAKLRQTSPPDRHQIAARPSAPHPPTHRLPNAQSPIYNI